MTAPQPQFTYTTGTHTYGAAAPEHLRGTTVDTYKVLRDGHAIVHGDGTEADAQAKVAELVAEHTPTVVTFEDGSTLTLPKATADLVVGLSEDGYVVANSDGLQYGLTPCCFATATGVEGGIACRTCYDDVDWVLGGDMAVAVPVQPPRAPSLSEA